MDTKLKFSASLQEDCDKLFTSLKEHVYKTFSSTFKGKDMDSFFASVVQIIVLETFDLSHTMPAEIKSLQNRIISQYQLAIDDNFRPFLLQIAQYGQSLNIPTELLIDYCNVYVLKSIEKIAPKDISDMLKKDISIQAKQFLDNY
jgi:antitoxin component of RelBE/YafQ-DinJ toxin-antitoxin module